jgi:hypothetical protein
MDDTRPPSGWQAVLFAAPGRACRVPDALLVHLGFYLGVCSVFRLFSAS